MPGVSQSLPRPSDKWIPISILGFFLFLISGAIGMVFVSLHSFPGLVTENAYEKGIAYNKIIASAAAQDALHWKSSLVVKAEDGRVLGVDFVLKDKDAKPVAGADVHVKFVRPTQGGLDKTVAMKEMGKGHYVAREAMALPGVWDVQISVKAGSDVYQAAERAFAK